MKKLIILVSSMFFVTEAFAHHFYSKFPVTLKGYSGEKTNSVSYSGQIARHVLHDSLKKLAGKGDGGGNAAALEAHPPTHCGETMSCPWCSGAVCVRVSHHGERQP